SGVAAGRVGESEASIGFAVAVAALGVSSGANARAALRCEASRYRIAVKLVSAVAQKHAASTPILSHATERRRRALRRVTKSPSRAPTEPLIELVISRSCGGTGVRETAPSQINPRRGVTRCEEGGSSDSPSARSDKSRPTPRLSVIGPSPVYASWQARSAETNSRMVANRSSGFLAIARDTT